MFALPWKSPSPFAVGTFVRTPSMGQNADLGARLAAVREELDDLHAALGLIPMEIQESLIAEVGVRWTSCENAYHGAVAAPDPEGVAVAEDCVKRLKNAIQEAMATLTQPGAISIDEPAESVENGMDLPGTSESDVTKIAAIAGVSVLVAVLLYALSS